MKMIADDLIQAQKDGHISQDLRVDFIMYLLNKMVDFTADESFSSLFKSAEKMVKELTSLIFYGMVTRDNKPMDE